MRTLISCRDKDGEIESYNAENFNIFQETLLIVCNLKAGVDFVRKYTELFEFSRR
jgi:hypothetical protein